MAPSGLVAARVAEAAPFGMEFAMSLGGAAPRRATVAQGARLGSALAAKWTVGRTATVGIASLPEFPGLPDCRDWWDENPTSQHSRYSRCYVGLRMVAGEPLALNGVADRTLALDAPPMHIALADVFLEFDAPPRGYAAEASDPGGVRATVAGDVLALSAADCGAATVTVEATGADGGTAVRTFSVAVTDEECVRPFLRGWRLGLPARADR